MSPSIGFHSTYTCIDWVNILRLRSLISNKNIWHHLLISYQSNGGEWRGEIQIDLNLNYPLQIIIMQTTVVFIAKHPYLMMMAANKTLRQLNMFSSSEHFFFYFSSDFSRCNLISLALNNSAFCITSHLDLEFLFLLLFWMLWMLVTLNKLKHMTYHRSYVLKITTWERLLVQIYFSVSNEKIP